MMQPKNGYVRLSILQDDLVYFLKWMVAINAFTFLGVVMIGIIVLIASIKGNGALSVASDMLGMEANISMETTSMNRMIATSLGDTTALADRIASFPTQYPAINEEFWLILNELEEKMQGKEVVFNGNLDDVIVTFIETMKETTRTLKLAQEYLRPNSTLAHIMGNTFNITQIVEGMLEHGEIRIKL